MDDQNFKGHHESRIFKPTCRVITKLTNNETNNPSELPNMFKSMLCLKEQPNVFRVFLMFFNYSLPCIKSISCQLHFIPVLGTSVLPHSTQKKNQ